MNLNNKKVLNWVIILTAIIGGILAIAIYQYHSLIASGLLGISIIYLRFFRGKLNTAGTLEDLVIRNDKINLLIDLLFSSFSTTLALNAIIRVFIFLL